MQKYKRFFQMIKVDLHQSMSKRLLLAVLLIPLSFPMDTLVDWEYLFTSERLSVFYFYYHAVQYGGLFGRYFTSMFCALPYAMAFCSEYQSGMAVYLYPRSGKSEYCLSKFVVSTITGGLAMSVGTMLFVVVLSFVLPLVRPEDIVSVALYGEYLGMGSGVPFFLLAAFFAFLSGMLWGGLAVTVSAFLPNPYVVVATPFIAFFTIAQAGRLVGEGISFPLDRLLSMRYIIHSPEWTPVILFVVVIAILAVCAAIFLKKATGRVTYG